MSHPMSLLFYVDNLGLGGANQTTLTVAAGLKRRGHDVIFAAGDGPLRARLNQAGIDFVEMPGVGSIPSWTATKIIFAAVVARKIDLICSNGFDCTMAAIPAALMAGCGIVPTYGGLYNPPYPHPWVPLANIFSEELSWELIHRFGWKAENVVHLIARIDGERFHPGVVAETLRRKWNVTLRERLLVMVCRQDYGKYGGVMALLAAAPGLKKKVPDLRIALVGGGNAADAIARSVRAVHDEVGDEFIVMPGAILETEQAYVAADLVIANGSRSALEAMCCGKVVVSVGSNGFCGVLTRDTVASFRRFNFDKGRLAGNPLGQPERLVSVVADLLADRGLLAEVGRWSHAYATEHLLVKDRLPDFEAFYARGLAMAWTTPGMRWRLLRRWLLSLVAFKIYLLKSRVEAFRGRDRVRRGEALFPPVGDLNPGWETGIPVRIRT